MQVLSWQDTQATPLAPLAPMSPAAVNTVATQQVLMGKRFVQAVGKVAIDRLKLFEG